jgi:prolyl-tRNA synthetase
MKRVLCGPLRLPRPAVLARADALYERLRAAGVRVLYDDRPVRAGEKFADADLLGIPQRVILGDRSPQDDTYECVRRVDDQRSQVSFSALLETLAQA